MPPPPPDHVPKERPLRRSATPLRWTADDVARELQISRRQVTDLVAEGVLVARRDPGGRKLWFLPADVRAYVEGMPEAPRRPMGVRMVYQNAGVLRQRARRR